MDSAKERKMYYDMLHHIVYNTTPIYLRKCFMYLWNTKFPESPWQSNYESGKSLVDKIVQCLVKRDKVDGSEENMIREWIEKGFNGEEKPKIPKKIKKLAAPLQKLLAGDENDWDISALCYILLDSGLKLLKNGCRPGNKRAEPLHASEVMEKIRDVRNKVIAHVGQKSCPHNVYEKYQNIVEETRIALKRELGDEAVDEMDKAVAGWEKEYPEQLPPHIKQPNEYKLLGKGAMPNTDRSRQHFQGKP